MAKLKKDHEKWKTVIRTLLEENLMPQNEFAQKIGVSPQTVSNWLNDIRSPGIYAKRHILEIVTETKSQRGKNNDMLLSVDSKKNKEQFEKMIQGMTRKQVRRLMGMAGKMF